MLKHEVEVQDQEKSIPANRDGIEVPEPPGKKKYAHLDHEHLSLEDVKKETEP